MLSWLHKSCNLIKSKSSQEIVTSLWFCSVIFPLLVSVATISLLALKRKKKVLINYLVEDDSEKIVFYFIFLKHWSPTCIQFICFIYFCCADAPAVPQLYHKPGHRYNLSWVSIFCLAVLWLLSGPHAWAFSAWKQTRGKVEGGNACQSPSPLYSQQGAWNCFRVSNMQLQKSFWFIQFPALHKRSTYTLHFWKLVSCFEPSTLL